MCYFYINYLVFIICLYSKKKGNEYFYIIFDEMKYINFYFFLIMLIIVYYGNKGKGFICRWIFCFGKYIIDFDV